MTQKAGMNFRSLASNALAAFAAQGISMLASLVMALLVPKVLGVVAYGYWQLFVFYANCSGLFLLGLNDGVYLIEGGKTRDEVDKRSLNSQFAVGLLFQLAFGVCVASVAVFLAPNSERAFVMFAFSIYMVSFNASNYLGYLFQAMNETKLFSVMTALERLVFLIPVVLLVALRVPSFEPYVVIFIFARFLALAFCCWKARDILCAGLLSPGAAISATLRSAKIGLGLMVANVASMLIMGFARALVDFAWGVEVFGRVSFSLSIVNFFVTFVSQASMVLFPALRQGSEHERRSFYRGIRDMMEVALPGVYVLYFPVAWLLALWLPQYADSIHYFIILLPLCAFETKMDVCCTTYLKVFRKEQLLLRLNLATMACSALLSLVAVYELSSLDAVLFGVVACCIARSVWAERYLDGKLGVTHSLISVEEIFLTVCFVALSLTLTKVQAFVAYAMLYALYLLVNRGVVRQLFYATRRALQVKG